MMDQEHNDERSPLEVDEAMLEMHDFVGEMSDIEGYITSEEAEFALKMDSVKLDMPVQLDIQVGQHGEVIIGGSPPLYYVETTVMPVFHQMQIHIEIDKTES